MSWSVIRTSGSASAMLRMMGLMPGRPGHLAGRQRDVLPVRREDPVDEVEILFGEGAIEGLHGLALGAKTGDDGGGRWLAWEDSRFR